MDVRMDVRNEPKRLRWPMHGLLAQRCQFCDTSLTSREAQPFTLKNTGSFLSIQADFRSFWRHSDVKLDVKNCLSRRAPALRLACLAGAKNHLKRPGHAPIMPGPDSWLSVQASLLKRVTPLERKSNAAPFSHCNGRRCHPGNWLCDNHRCEHHSLLLAYWQSGNRGCHRHALLPGSVDGKLYVVAYRHLGAPAPYYHCRRSGGLSRYGWQDCASFSDA